MNSSLFAKSAAPHGPMPMLAWADHLEECGDLAGAEVLRGLAAAGYASLAGLACMPAAEPRADDFRLEYRPPIDMPIGFGRGDGFDEGGGDGSGEAEFPSHLEVGGYGEGLLGIDSAELPGRGGRRRERE